MPDESMDPYQKGIEDERKRCADIIQMARADEIDRDWRSIIFIIKCGDSIEDIKKSLNIEE